jgi:SAM-dependent methyltransferase
VADYQLPRTDGEARRLAIQSELLAEATELTLAGAGIARATSCIDIGCGTGDAMVAMARMTPNARIVGLDLDTSPARARHGERFELVTGDLFGATGAFDFVFSRYVLHHMPDPARALAKMWSLVKPSGTLAVLDIDQRGTTTHPLWEPYERLEGYIRALYERLGIDNHIGHKLPHLFERAGIGEPDGTEVIGVIRKVSELREFLPLLFDMIKDKLAAHGVATIDAIRALEVQLATAHEQTSYCYRPTAVGVWRHKPM